MIITADSLPQGTGGLSLADTWWPDLGVTMEVGNLLHDYIAGAIGGTAGLVIGHPFDTTKLWYPLPHGHASSGIHYHKDMPVLVSTTTWTCQLWYPLPHDMDMSALVSTTTRTCQFWYPLPHGHANSGIHYHKDISALASTTTWTCQLWYPLPQGHASSGIHYHMDMLALVSTTTWICQH
ncbi:hypothetical protein LSAT2_002622 [Lamellibrachia satsuma]|nr:hypothetical protein LSAT2_002622 [Lamellibrachia satsuma]